MAAMTEQIIAMSIKSLEEQNTKLARETVEFDAKINEAEREMLHINEGRTAVLHRRSERAVLPGR